MMNDDELTAISKEYRMLYQSRSAKINLKVLIIFVIVTVAVVVSLVAARQVRRSILSKMSLEAGTAAFENGDWSVAYKQLQEYLGRNPDDVEILKKYGQARLSVQPMEAPHIRQAIAAYRRVMQLSPADDVAYEKLAMLYASLGNFEELAYIARKRLGYAPNDPDASLRLADALIQLNKTTEAVETLCGFMDGCDPNEHALEYARACLKMAMVQGRDDYLAPAKDLDGEEANRPTTPLAWLNEAIKRAPDSAEVWVSRAQFYREHADSVDPNEGSALPLARSDLDTASQLDIQDPRVYFVLCFEWMAHGESDRAAAALEAAERLPLETIREHFLFLDGWTRGKFVLAAELALRQGAAEEGAALADEALETLKDERQRIGALPYAIQLYLAEGRVMDAKDVPDANDCLDEYIDLQYTLGLAGRSTLETNYLRALVSRAKGDSYAVIDALQPAVAGGVSRASLWRLLAEAFTRTDQTRRAVDALINYLRLRPRDPEMTLKLAKEYLKLRDWNRAFETARLGQTLDPTDVLLKLLRIEASVYLAEQQESLDESRLLALAQDLGKLREKHPRRVDIRILQAMIAVYRERPDEAEAELKQAIDQCDEPLRAEMQLVRHYFRLKRMPEAVGVCQAACKNHPEVAEPWLSLAGLHVANGSDYEVAIECLKDANDAVVGKWEHRSVSMRLAVLELMHGDRDSGTQRLIELAKMDRREVRARTLLLGMDAVEKDKVWAQALMEELREAEGETGLQWRLHQASMWLGSDDWRSKQQDIKDMLEYCTTSDPQWSTPYMLLANMYEKLEDLPRVESVCRQALLRNPAATDVADKLIDVLEKQDRLGEAMEVADKAEADPRTKSAWHVGGALRAGDFSKAIEELQLRAANDSQDAQSRIFLARLLYGQDKKNVDQALAYLKEAETITSGSLAITALRASILRSEGRQDEARRILDDYVTQEDDFNSRHLRAAYLAREGEIEKAEAEYRKLTHDPNQADIGYLLLSSFYRQTSRLDDAIETLQEGDAKFEEGLITPAKDPNGSRLKRGLMKVLFLRGQPQDREVAKGLLTELEGRMPADPELMNFRAMQLLAEHREDPKPELLNAAKAKLESVIRIEPTAVNAHLALIGLTIQEGKYAVARERVIRAIGSNPSNVALMSARAQIELALNNTQMAIELAQLILAEDPNSVTAREMVLATARQTRDEGLLQQARRLLEADLVADPGNEQLLLSRAQVLVFLGQAQEAIPELETYCQTDKGRGRVDAIVTLADLYRIAGDMEQAGQKLEQAEKIDAANQNVIHARLLWLVAQGQFDDIEETVSAYLLAKEQDPAIALKAASVLAVTDSTLVKRQAVKLFQHVISLSPDSLNARLGLASVLYQIGDAKEAKKLYQELVDEYPKNLQILNDLAWILQESDRRYAEALEFANRGLDLRSDNLNLLDTRGTILKNMPERLDDAKRDFERLLGLSSADTGRRAKALLQLGRIHAKLNDLNQAKQCFQAALEIDRKIDAFTPDERAEIAAVL